MPPWPRYRFQFQTHTVNTHIELFIINCTNVIMVRDGAVNITVEYVHHCGFMYKLVDCIHVIFGHKRQLWIMSMGYLFLCAVRNVYCHVISL